MIRILVVAVWMLPSAAWAFSAAGHKWPAAESPIPYQLHSAGTGDVTDGTDLEAVRRAFTTWADVECSSIGFLEVSFVEPRTTGHDGNNRVFWAEVAEEWPSDEETIGITLNVVRIADQVIVDTDIVFNGVDYTWTTDGDAASQEGVVDVETIALHEAGHFVGLDHSADTEAAMFRSNNAPVRRAPAADDINGICFLYPNGIAPPSGRGIGDDCEANGDCQSGICAGDSIVDRDYCSAQCTVPDTTVCPEEYPCTEANGQTLCLAQVQPDELCDICETGAHCASGVCLTVGSINFFQSFCTQVCDPTPGVTGQCPSGYHCEGIVDGGFIGGACAPNTGVCDPLGKGGQNEPCYANGTCKAGNFCVQYYLDSGLNYCFAECPAALIGRSCTNANRTLCLPVDVNNAFGRMNVSTCFEVSSVNQPCIPELCEDGTLCAFDETIGTDTALCYKTCAAGSTDCPANTQCQDAGGVLLCVPNVGFKPVGSGCASDDECASRQCRVFAEQRLCTQDCLTNDATSCPGGTRCVGTGQGAGGQCWPNSLFGTGPEPPPGPNCECDTTNDCDADCSCDPECDSEEGCGCDTTGGSTNLAGWFALLLVVLGLRHARVRRRFG